MLRVKRIQCNALAENCYIVSADTESPECIIIDCGALGVAEQTAIRDYITEEGLKPVQHLLTHGHFDHVTGSQFVFDTWGIRPTISERDAELYKASKRMAEAMGMITDDVPAIGRCLNDGDTVPFAGGEKVFRVIATPGHTRGGVVYYCETDAVAFTGDTLFRGCIGRTDFEGGSTFMIIQSLRQLMQLPDETRIFPGHGEETTIGYELTHNPYLDR